MTLSVQRGFGGICIRALVFLLCLGWSIPGAATSLAEQCNIGISKFTYSLAVSDEGIMAAVEEAATGAVLAIYGPDGTAFKRWSAPDGRSFEYCEISGEYVLATYGAGVALFSDYGRKQEWGRRFADLWGYACSLDTVEQRVIAADYPLDGSSTVWAISFSGTVLWQHNLPSLVTDTAICEAGHVAVAGEQYGLMLDKGRHAVYLLSPTGTEQWHFETSSPAIDIAMSSDGLWLLAGLDNGGMVFLENRSRLLGREPRLLWSKDDIGGYVDLAADAGTAVAATSDMDLALLSSSGEEIWTSGRRDVFGDRDEICISADGSLIAAVGLAMKWDDNPALIYASTGNVLYESFSSSTRPSVAVSPNGRYVAVASGFRLRLFEVKD